MDYKLFATKDNAEGQLDSGISAAATTFSLGTNEGDEYPATKNGSATSGGSSTALNSTGIGAKVTVGDFIYNVTDGSHAFIKTVNTNDIVTTALQGGSDNTWDNSDVWVVNPFVVTFNKRNASGVITQSEKALIQTRVTGTDDFTTFTGGRGFDGDTPASFDAGDYVNLFSVSKSIEFIIDSLAEQAIDISNLDSDKADQSTVTALLNSRNWKQSVRVATAAAGTLASDFENGDTVDGIVLATGDRILIKDQGTASENGIYTVNASGAPTRATDFDSAEEATSAVVATEEGTAQADTVWICTDEDPVIDTDPITFVQFGSVNTIASQSEAELAVDNTKTMTPLRTRQAQDYHDELRYTVWEDITANNTVAILPIEVEWFDQLTEVAINLGDTNANRRQSFLITPSQAVAVVPSFNFRLLKVLAGQNVTVRIETDNAGEPSGTLVDANATATILASAISTSFDTEVASWAGAFAASLGVDVHVVLQVAGTDAANYIQISVNSSHDENYLTFTRLTYDLDAGTWGGSVTNATPFFWPATRGALGLGAVPTDARYPNRVWTFRGFAKTTVSAGNEVALYRTIATGLSSIEDSVDYYLSSTPGGITTTPPDGTFGNDARFKIGIGYGEDAIEVIRGEKAMWGKQTVDTTQLYNFLTWFEITHAKCLWGSAGTGQFWRNGEGIWHRGGQPDSYGSGSALADTDFYDTDNGSAAGTINRGALSNLTKAGFDLNNVNTSGTNDLFLKVTA